LQLHKSGLADSIELGIDWVRVVTEGSS